MQQTIEREISGNVSMNEITEQVGGRSYFETTKVKNYQQLKRFIDVFLSAFALIVLSPFLIVIAVIIALESKGGVFFSQVRVGKDGKLFKMYKFRSMVQDAESQLFKLAKLNERDGPAFKIANDPRITRIGKWLRKSNVDELPQLFNILCGDMSIVGPRPALPSEVEQYNDYQMQRIRCKPGLTCYWQVSERKMEFNDWVALDLKYIYNQSFKTDVILIMKTVMHVLRLKGM